MTHEIDVDAGEDLDLALDFDPIEDVDFFTRDSPPEGKTGQAAAAEKKTIRARQTSIDDGQKKSRHPPVRVDFAQEKPEDESEKAKRRIARAQRFGIQPVIQSPIINDAELEDLYASMDVDRFDGRQRLEAIFMRGVDNMTTFDVERIFAEYQPDRVDWVDDSSCNVAWTNRRQAAQAMLMLTRPLKRVRSTRQPEEGELATESDEEEEGQLKTERGEDVALKGKSDQPGNEPIEPTGVHSGKDYVEIDVEQVDVPPGKWRVITSHVSSTTLLIVRFSRVTDIKDPKITLESGLRSARPDLRIGAAGLISGTRKRLLAGDHVSKRKSSEEGEFSYKWTDRAKVRPGLNIFTNDGKELEWDYEHDTRYYVDVDAPEESGKKGKAAATVTGTAMQSDVISNVRRPKVRGRGAKKAKLIDDILAEDTMRADDEVQKRSRRRDRPLGADRGDANDDRRSDSTGARWSSAMVDDDDDGFADRDPSPTPQPWDRRSSKLQINVSSRPSVHERLQISLPNNRKRRPLSRDDEYYVSDPEE